MDTVRSGVASDLVKPVGKTMHALPEKQSSSVASKVNIPAVILPKGGGALKGIDEQFTVNAVNGTSSLQFPLPVSPARGGLPDLQLTYNSGAGNGIFGMGWDLNLSVIKRKTDKGIPVYHDDLETDTFLLTDVDELVPQLKRAADGGMVRDTVGKELYDEWSSPDGNYTIRCYRPRTEGKFARIERWKSVVSPEVKWRIISSGNLTTLYGWSANARISDPADPFRIFQWMPEFVYDDQGNCCHYQYKKEDKAGFDQSLLHHRNRLSKGELTYTNLYPEKVLYGNKAPYTSPEQAFPMPEDYFFQTIFDYGEYAQQAPYTKSSEWGFRQDACSVYNSGFEIRTTRLCRRVLQMHYFDELPGSAALVKSMDFAYDYNISAGLTFLQAITITGYIKKENGSYSSKSLPPLTLSYQQPEWNKTIQQPDTASAVHLPQGLTGDYLLTDLYNEGMNGILVEQAEGWYYKRNLGEGRFTPARLIAARPSFDGLGNTWQLADLDADGSKQLTSFAASAPGYFEVDEKGCWKGFRPFEKVPSLDMSDPGLRMIDLNGDGKPDLLIAADNVFTWYPGYGKNGYDKACQVLLPADEEAGPRVIFTDAQETFFLADMSGDGLTDIVRIRHAEVCYWPNLGYGKFGAKINMGHAPLLDTQDAFQPRFVRLADIDGSGTADLIYLGKNKCSCWQNQCGNAFSITPVEIDNFPDIHPAANVIVADLLGNGVACIVWSDNLPAAADSPLRYIDLLQGRKPYLLTGYKNNMGKEVMLTYAPSTKFYLEDELAGHPWITRLHFPVHCIAAVETRDLISGHRSVSTYKYHHGYYDHTEREFRGFGMVEHTDAEELKYWTKTDIDRMGEQSLQQPAVTTRTWYHTGIWSGLQGGLTAYTGDYWYDRVPAASLEKIQPGLLLPAELTVDECREAWRACRGKVIRIEIFMEDRVGDKAMAVLPYSVTTFSCSARLLQPRTSQQHAVLAVFPHETIAYTYEQNVTDPRVQQELQLRTDDFGHPLETVTVIYPRISPDDSLPQEVQEAQATLMITYNQYRYTNIIIDEDTYLLPLKAETKTFELYHIKRAATWYDVSDFRHIISETTALPYYATPVPVIPQHRLIANICTRYKDNTLLASLPLFTRDRYAFTDQQYQLAFPDSLVGYVYGDKVTSDLMSAGKYVRFPDADGWWIPSGTTQLLQIGETVTAAQHRFFLPVSYTDAAGSVTKLGYYKDYWLLLQHTEDALGNRITATVFNFYTLEAEQLKDSNDNITAVLSDELGLTKATAVMGKGEEADDLLHLTAETTETEQQLVQEFFHAEDAVTLTSLAKQLLQHGSVRMVYNVNAYMETGKPAVVATIQRTTHYRENPDSDVQITFEYTNGLGQVIMKKMQAAPGIAKKLTIHTASHYTIEEVNTATLVPQQLRWLASGRTVLNNKGNPVKKYEPYYALSPQFEEAAELVEKGVSTLFYYDAMGRLIKTVYSDSTLSRVTFTPWKQQLYDRNDTVLESKWYHDRVGHLLDDVFLMQGRDPEMEKVAAEQTAQHAQTPLMIHFDVMGRSLLQVEHNRDAETGAAVYFSTFFKMDITGNLLWVRDARGNVVLRNTWEMSGRNVYQWHMDQGEGWLFPDVLQLPLSKWDARGYQFLYDYDTLHRLVSATVKGGDGPIPMDHCYEYIIYGETAIDPKQLNLCGRELLHYDTAGVISIPAYDFKGNPRSVSRQLFKDFTTVPDWKTARSSTKLEETIFTEYTVFNALGLVVRQQKPDGSIVLPGYDEGGYLVQEEVVHPQSAGPVAYISQIGYNEKGQRNKIIYGNGVVTNFSYDPLTLRLTAVSSRRGNDDPLQDLRYTYDPSGNITHIADHNIPVTFAGNQLISGINTYQYDACYRLITATGRENNAALLFEAADNWADAPYLSSLHPGDPSLMRNYKQQYVYDAVGNILQMRHQATGNNWGRQYDYATENNRLLNTRSGNYTYHYSYDTAHGNMTAMPHLQELGWSFSNELVKSVAQRRTDGGIPETTWYQYDYAGTRIRKITTLAAAPNAVPVIKEERIYINTFEVYKKYSGQHAGLERTTLSLMDGTHRFTMIETRNGINDGSPEQLVRYQLFNQIGSSCLEVDNTTAAAVISYEEFHPFGTTAYQWLNAAIKAAAKRYRYTGMERDEETGLACHGARYYAPWLARWTASDPLGIEAGINGYRYVSNRPVSFIDPEGMAERPKFDFSNDIHDVVEAQVREAAFDGGRQLQTGKVKATSGGVELPPPTGDQLAKIAEASPEGRALRLKYAGAQGQAADKSLRTSIRERSIAAMEGQKGGHYGEASGKLVSELGMKDAKITSVDKNPGGMEAGTRTGDIGILKEATSAKNWQTTLEGKAPADVLEGIKDVKMGNGVVADKAGFKEASGGVGISEVRPFSKGLKAGVGTLGAVADIAGIFLMARNKNMEDSGVVPSNTPAELRDKDGSYMLIRHPKFFHNRYSKQYTSGPKKGTTTDLGFWEGREEREKFDAAFGSFDFWGNFEQGSIPPRLSPYDGMI
ncbi:SpvB/TcaC N-terminal domain-containing protein [Chitinophaga sp. HK235]|uniref:SpvB/TcaC N-terminal domain-containing protein n=1 Tax=Chitinophaga sp. HK235 TaxID=2952571 RepID=UPI001BAC18E9|nr:SpvB/TcaC N-terminal domain-containing protein [Chitinophaga sp. HK235]